MQSGIVRFMTVILTLIITFTISGLAQEDTLLIKTPQAEEAEKIIGLEFTPSERDSILDDLNYNLGFYEKMREVSIDNFVSPAFIFNPLPRGVKPNTKQKPLVYSPIGEITRPENPEDLAFYSVRELAELLRTRKVTSTELTRLSLDRLKKYEPQLHCVVTLTEELAFKQAARADSEISAGNYRGPLHGIPYGAKDLLAKKGYKTTWGAMPYKPPL